MRQKAEERRQTMQEHKKRQGGFILPTVLVMGAVLLVFATVLLFVLQSEMRNSNNSRSKDADAAGADAAFQRAVAYLNNTGNYSIPGPNGTPTPIIGVSNWGGPWDANYASLTTYPFTEISGVAYSISIAAGELSNTGSAAAAPTLWVNKGDLGQDRTIFVRLKYTTANNNRVENYFQKIHRTDPVFVPGEVGMYTTGCNNLGAVWNGNAFDSCLGAADTINAYGSSECTGSLTALCFQGGNNFCLSENDELSMGHPPASPPTPVFTPQPTTQPVPGNASVSGSLSGPMVLGPAPAGAGMINYQVSDVVLNGNPEIDVDASAGPVNLYVTGSWTISGGPNIYVISAYGCCKASSFTVYMVNGGDVHLNGNMIFEGSFYAPQSSFTFNGGGGGYFSGTIVGKDWSTQGGGTSWFHEDQCMQHGRINTYVNPPVLINAWQIY
jgi:hypothetical protein